MDSISSSSANMDKKALTTRFQQLPSKNGSSAEPPLKDYGKKSGPQYVRKREVDRPEVGRKPVAGRGGRTGQRYVRPREKTGCQVELCEGASEVGSLYRAGGKKQNITHLMNWWGPGYRSHHPHGVGERGYQSSGGARIRRYSAHTPKYSKEHYLQANCQFVVEEGEDYSVYIASPDLLVEWKLVEEVRLHVSEAPSCPICLHHPSAAKVTRCGHIYCFPCILHYLALSDDKWRKCPICYAPVERDDLKSVIAIVHKDFGIGEEIELQLMRRERDSLIPVPASSFSQKVIEGIPRVGSTSPATTYSKLLLASKEEVKTHILDREHRDLTAQLVEEGDQPEACFISEALTLLQSRRDDISRGTTVRDSVTKLDEDLDRLSLSSPDEPSSCESLPSFEEPMSPLSPDDSKVPYPCELPLEGDQIKGLAVVEGLDTPTPAVTVDDLDISQLQPANLNSQGGQGQRNTPKATFFFYQASNGAQIYLHSLNVKMLVHEYGSLENCPSSIKARVLEKESASMTEELRNRLRYLRHLPVSCSFDVVEVALGQPLLSKLTLSLFQDQVEMRQRKRNKRAREERKIAKRVQAEEDRLMGRSKGARGMKTDSLTHFPAFGDEFPSSAITMVPEQSSAGCSNHSGSELGTSPASDSLYGSSTDTNGTGVSFARMIREGQTKLPHSRSEPKSLGDSDMLWPSLGGTSNAKQGGGVTTVKSNIQSSWGMKHSASFSAGVNQEQQHHHDEEDSDDECAVAVPEFKRSFSNAIAQALDNAAKNAALAKTEVSGNVGKKGKKKKQKQVLLFSSGGFK